MCFPGQPQSIPNKKELIDFSKGSILLNSIFGRQEVQEIHIKNSKHFSIRFFCVFVKICFEWAEANKAH